MIDDAGWFDWMIDDWGPQDRILSALKTPVDVYTLHSMEGTYAFPNGFIVLRDPQYKPTAWHWTKMRDGRVMQHYPLQTHLQHGHAANNLGPGGEAEGFASDPLTPAQVAADLRIIDDINQWRTRNGKAPLIREATRPQGRARGLVEHREMAPARNTTQCPSERYAPLWAALDVRNVPVTRGEFDAALKRIYQLETQLWGEFPKPRDNANPYADVDMFDVERMYADVARLKSPAHVPDHKHSPGGIQQ